MYKSQFKYLRGVSVFTYDGETEHRTDLGACGVIRRNCFRNYDFTSNEFEPRCPTFILPGVYSYTDETGWVRTSLSELPEEDGIYLKIYSNQAYTQKVKEGTTREAEMLKYSSECTVITEVFVVDGDFKESRTGDYVAMRPNQPIVMGVRAFTYKKTWCGGYRMKHF